MMRKLGYNNRERENRTAFEVGFCLGETFVIATGPVGTLYVLFSDYTYHQEISGAFSFCEALPTYVEVCRLCRVCSRKTRLKRRVGKKQARRILRRIPLSDTTLVGYYPH